jgi:hypothetical protein
MRLFDSFTRRAVDRYRTAIIFGIYFILFTGLLFAAIDLQKGEQK